VDGEPKELFCTLYKLFQTLNLIECQRRQLTQRRINPLKRKALHRGNRVERNNYSKVKKQGARFIEPGFFCFYNSPFFKARFPGFYGARCSENNLPAGRHLSLSIRCPFITSYTSQRRNTWNNRGEHLEHNGELLEQKGKTLHSSAREYLEQGNYTYSI